MTTRIAGLALAALCFAGGGCSRRAAPPRFGPADVPLADSADIGISTGFRCLWWSPEQMEKLDPNAPPAKTTPTPIEKWDASDPVGTPHPDTVTCYVVISNRSPSSRASVEATWVVSVRLDTEDGPSAPRSGTQDGSRISVTRNTEIPEGGHREFECPIDVASILERSIAVERWPGRILVDVTISNLKDGSVIDRRRIVLPVLRAD